MQHLNKFRLQNKYYLKTDREKRLFTGKIALLLILLILVFSSIALYFQVYLPAPFVIWILISILAPFFDTPTLVKQGKLKYYSSMLLAENEKNNTVVIHGATLFDYYFTLDTKLTGRQRKNFILQQFIDGLLKLIQERKDENVKIKGTTYIFNERTGRKLGFSCGKPDFIQTLILILNYPNLMLASSFAAKRLAFPDLRDIRTFRTDLSVLKSRQIQIENLNDRLRRTAGNNGFCKQANA